METRTDWASLIGQLSEPFSANAISWRAGRRSNDGKRAQALPYAEPRIYEDRLNSLCPGAWSVLFKPWGEHKVICELTLFGVVRSSTGEYEESAKNAVAQGTVAEAQAFKRACSKFGLGRYLYDLPITWVGYDESSRRLTETPTLEWTSGPRTVSLTAESGPSSLPERAVAALSRAEPKLLKVPATSSEPMLSAKRADAMRRELQKRGFVPEEQHRLAERVLGHKVASFSELTESEALEVWNVARRTPKPSGGAPRAVGF